MLVSVSRRTDIPRWYPEWFQDRLEDGFCLVRNPFNRNQVSRISLKREDVDCFVFWTRFPSPFFSVLELLESRGFPQVMFITITGYPEILEPGAPPFYEALESFREVSRLFGKDRVWLRFDPIIRTGLTSLDFIKNRFKTIIGALSGYTDHAVTSFYDSYAASGRALSRAGLVPVPIDPDDPETGQFLQDLAEIALAEGITVSACAEPHDLARFGIESSACIDLKRINSALGLSIKAERDRNQRPNCACAVSRDIGSYHSCPSGCLYCYAGAFRKESAMFTGEDPKKAPGASGA